MSEESWSFRADPWGEPTDWSLVVRAAGAEVGPEQDQTWRALVERYRGVIATAVRRRCWDGARADELAADFFAYLYTGQVLAKARRERGTFRAFLQGVLKRYLTHQFTLRGPGRREVALVGEVAVHETPEIETAELVDWARAVLDNSLRELEAENPRSAELLRRVHGLPPYPATSREALAAEYDLTPNALYQALFRARVRLRELVLAEVRRTVLSQADFDQESRVIIARLLEGWRHVFSE